jgi:predicted AlkP superfamily pyrophosphatase or phosphodiesterase
MGAGPPMRKTAAINVVGLTRDLIGPSMPAVNAWSAGARIASIEEVIPAVTCTAQATFFTGTLPREHGIVANGWYFRDECEVKFWRQSNKLVQGEKVWEKARSLDASFTCANLFGWYNMYSSVDYSVTPRPMYPADGRKIPDIYTHPAPVREDLQRKLGTFPLFDFWGPKTSIRSSKWIAEAAKYIDEQHDPTLTLIYLPHLDYNLQRLGPKHPGTGRDLSEIDVVCGDLIRFYEGRGAQVILFSEYGITEVRTPIHINRALREAGLIAVREELGRELLDAGASAAFAVADHQIAHVYVNDSRRLNQVRAIVEALPGVERVLDQQGKAACGLDHPRSGELIAISKADAWFTYYYWLDDRRAPDFAKTVDIHRKPGYDPAELFIDPALAFPLLKAGTALLKKKLGFRYLMDLIPLDATLVKGSHGRPVDNPSEGPVFMTRQNVLPEGGRILSTAVADLLLRHVLDEAG